MSDLRINAQLAPTTARMRLEANSGKGICLFILESDNTLYATFPDGTIRKATVVATFLTFPVAP